MLYVQVAELEKGMAHYTKDKHSLQQTKARLAQLTKNHDALTWEHEVLEQRFDQVCAEV